MQRTLLVALQLSLAGAHVMQGADPVRQQPGVVSDQVLQLRAPARLSQPAHAYRFDAPDDQTGGGAAPAAESGKQQGERSKGLMWLGLGLIGGGAALMIANPDVSEYTINSRGELYKKSYRVQLAGGVIAGSGGLMLWRGLKRR